MSTFDKNSITKMCNFHKGFFVFTVFDPWHFKLIVHKNLKGHGNPFFKTGNYLNRLHHSGMQKPKPWNHFATIKFSYKSTLRKKKISYNVSWFYSATMWLTILLCTQCMWIFLAHVFADYLKLTKFRMEI